MEGRGGKVTDSLRERLDKWASVNGGPGNNQGRLAARIPRLQSGGPRRCRLQSRAASPPPLPRMARIS